MRTTETHPRDLVLAAVEEHTRPAGPSLGDYAIVISRAHLAEVTGLPLAEATAAAEWLAKYRIVDRAKCSDGRVYYQRKPGGRS